MPPIDQVQLHFNPQTLQILNAVLGLVMFGVALDLKVEDFRSALKTAQGAGPGPVWPPHAVSGHDLCAGLDSAAPAQHCSGHDSGVVLPGRAHLQLSGAFLSGQHGAVGQRERLVHRVALVMTPLNFAFWGNLSPVTSGLMKEVAMSPWEMLEVIVCCSACRWWWACGWHAVPRLCAHAPTSR